MARPKKIVEEVTTVDPVVALKSEVVKQAVAATTVAPSKSKPVEFNFKVSDPQVLRPKELPLVIEAPATGWANKEQAEYASTLNGYAYKNPEKWALKKGALLKTLHELATNPSKITVLRGNDTRLSYSNELMKNTLDR